MSDLPIQITLDPAPAVQGSRAITEATAKTELAAKRAQKSFEDYEKQLAKTQKEMDALAAASKRSGNAVANQRNDAQKAMDTIGLGPAKMPKSAGMQQIEDFAVSGATGAVAAGLAAAAHGWVEYEQAQTAAHNSLRKFFETADRTNQVLDSQTLAASHLNVDVREMAGALADVKEASEGAYLSTLQQIDATRTLGEAMQMEGKPVGEAGNVMKQLQLAMEVGTVTGLQFRTMLRENDDVVEVLTEKTGKSAKQLMDMAKAGQFNRDMIKTWFDALADGTAVHEKWNQREKVGVDLMIDLIPAMKDARQEMEAQNRAVLEAADVWEKFGLKFQEMHDLIEARSAGLAGGVNQEKVNRAMRETALAVTKASKDLDAHNDLMNFVGDDGAKKYYERLDELNKELKLGTIDQLTYNLGLEKLNKTSNEGAKAVSKHAQEIRELQKLLFEGKGEVKPQSNNAQWEIEKAARERQTALQSAFDDFDKPRGMPIGAGRTGGLSTAPAIEPAAPIVEITDTTKQWNLELEKAQDTTKEINDMIGGEIVDSTKTLFGAVTDAAKGADVAWGKTIENMLSGFAEAILQAELLQLLTGSASGAAGAGIHGGYGGLLGIFGGSTGFDYLAGSGPHFPGFATGGDMMVGGAGGVDSRLAMFRVTPGESIHVRTPEQRREMDRGSTGGGLRVVQVNADPRALYPMIGGGDDDVVLLRLLARNADKVRSLIAR